MTSADRIKRAVAVASPRLVAATGSDNDDDGRGRQLISRALHEITQLSPQKQLAVGGLSGIAAGYCFAKASKAVAFTIGASILGLALANQSGYVDIHFDRIRHSAEQRLNQVQQVAAATLPRPATTNIDGEEIETFVDQSSNHVVNTIKNFAIANLAITSSFIGGFLLGVAFE